MLTDQVNKLNIIMVNLLGLCVRYILQIKHHSGNESRIQNVIHGSNVVGRIPPRPGQALVGTICTAATVRYYIYCAINLRAIFFCEMESRRVLKTQAGLAL